MEMPKWLERIVSPRPRVIEVIALLVGTSVLIAGCWTILRMSPADFTREKILPILDVVVSALGVASLLFLWAQLRYTATQHKLISYHEHFHDLPKPANVSAMYAAMGRLGIERPLWHSPLTIPQRDAILNDTAPAQDAAHTVVREYLNDFEEFAAAINSGLVDDEYAYHIESARALNAYFGFKSLISFWLVEERTRADGNRVVEIAPSDFYGELGKVAERWKSRKLAELARDQKRRHRGISGRL